MNTVLWAVQVVLFFKLFSVAVNHGLRQEMTTMREAIAAGGEPSRRVLYVSTVLNVVASIGLLLPWWVDLPAATVPILASGIVFLLVVSLYFHVRTREAPKVFVTIVLIILAVFLAYGRWQLAPL